MQGKKLVVLGGSAGLGLATALAAQAAGARIVIASRSQEKLEKARKQFKAPIDAHSVNIADEADVEKLFAKIGPFNYLVSTAGVSSAGGCLTLDTRVAKESFDNKFWGQYFAVKYGAKRMSKDGAIVLFGGAFSQRPIKDVAIMASINGAIESLVRALAIELAPIRINAVSPGVFATERLSDLKRSPDLSDQLIQRLGKPEEAAQTILYLLTNQYTTGATLYPDGGYLFR